MATWLHSRGIMSKLLGSFLVVCALTALVGYVGVSTAATVKQRLDATTGTLLPGTSALGRTKAALFTAARDIRNALLIEDHDEAERWLGRVRQDFQDSERAFAEYSALPMTVEEAQLVAAYEPVRRARQLELERASAELSRHTPEGDAAALEILMVTSQPQAVAPATAATTRSRITRRRRWCRPRRRP